MKQQKSWKQAALNKQNKKKTKQDNEKSIENWKINRNFYFKTDNDHKK